MIPLALAAKGPQPGAATADRCATAEDKTPPAEEPTGGDSGCRHGCRAIERTRRDCASSLPQLPKDTSDRTTRATCRRQGRSKATCRRDAQRRDGPHGELGSQRVKRVAEKASRFDSRLREFYDKHKLTMERSLRDPLYSLYAVTEPAYRRLPSTVAETHIKESLRQLDALTDCTADQLAAKVDECVSKWHEERATVTL
jgi:hypothetical protein